MITVTITNADACKGVRHVVQILRAGGIPCRVSSDGRDIRLCKEWEGADEKLGSGRCIGYGVLCSEYDRLRDCTLFHYTPPLRAGEHTQTFEDGNVIDVEARVVEETLLIASPAPQPTSSKT